MMTEVRVQNSSQFMQKVVYTVLCICLFIIIAILLNADWRSKTRLWFLGSDRKILATLREDLDASGRSITVFKVKEKGNLFIELYATGLNNDESSDPQAILPLELIQKIEFSGAIDGYVNFMGQATNLAVANLDDDPYLEIIVPYYNMEFAANLEIIKYNPEFKKFMVMHDFNISKSLLESVSRGENEKD